MGNPLNYMGAPMTWDVKGNLISVSGRNGKSATYTYLSDRQRYTKTTGGKTTTYLYNNGLLLSETTGNEGVTWNNIKIGINIVNAVVEEKKDKSKKEITEDGTDESKTGKKKNSTKGER